MITGITESKTVAKDISCECKYEFDGTKCNSNQWWNDDKCRCECKKHICENDYVWNPTKRNCEKGKYLASIISDSMIICDEVIKSYSEEIKLLQQILMKKIQLVKHKISIFYLLFY